MNLSVEFSVPMMKNSEICIFPGHSHDRKIPSLYKRTFVMVGAVQVYTASWVWFGLVIEQVV